MNNLLSIAENNFLLNNSFQIFGLTIRYYALCLMAGFLCGAAVAYYMFKRRGIKPDLILDVLIAVIPCSIICARIWYVVFDLDEFMVNGKPDFLKMINITTGGNSILGGIIGGALGLVIVSLIHKVPFTRLGDIGALVLPIGQAVGRMGNYFNQEVYGQVTDQTWFPYSVFIEADGKYHVALCFHEMILNLIVFALLFVFLYYYKGRRNGYAIGAYLFFYGLIRAVMEPMRDAQFNMGEQFLGLPGMTWISILMMLFGLGYFVFLLIKDIMEKQYWWKGFFKKEAVVPQGAAQDSVLSQTVEEEKSDYSDGQNLSEQSDFDEKNDNLNE